MMAREMGGAEVPRASSVMSAMVGFQIFTSFATIAPESSSLVGQGRIRRPKSAGKQSSREKKRIHGLNQPSHLRNCYWASAVLQLVQEGSCWKELSFTQELPRLAFPLTCK